jgi:peptidoglycan hydrolase CwlO-like protein
MNRIGDGTKVNPGELTLGIQKLDTQIQDEKLTLSRINRSNTSAIEKQKKIISSLEDKRRLAENEKNTLKSDAVIAKCYQPALASAKKAEPAIADAKKVVEEAQNKLQENTDNIKTIEGKITESNNAIKQLEEQISQTEKDLKNLENPDGSDGGEDNKRTKVG